MPKTNQAGLSLIKSFEGLRLTAYQDQADVWTVGYGHTGSDVKQGLTITQAQADAFLQADLAGAEQAVQRCVAVLLTANQFAALVSLVYNIGEGAFADSTLLKKLNAGDDAGAADQFLAWNKITIGGALTVSEGLNNRRTAERALFLSGQASVPLAAPVAPQTAAAAPPFPAVMPAGQWLLVSPADQQKPTHVRIITDADLDMIRWIANGDGKPAFLVNEKTRRVYFLHSPAPRAPAAAATVSAVPVGPSIKDRMKTGDLHLVADRLTGSAQAFDNLGKKVWEEALAVRLQGVNGGTLEHPIWNRTGSDTPPGLWIAYRFERIARGADGWIPYGRGYVYLRPIGGIAATYGDVGIGLHGGGTGLEDPYAAMQELLKTEGCIRAHNQDIEATIGPLVEKVTASGHVFYLTSQ